jgi:hypothetical protein
MVRNWMKACVATLTLAATAAAGPEVRASGPGQGSAESAVTESCYGCWKLDSRYSCYCDACDRADYLRECGYQARVVKCGYYWCVYYRY